MLRKETIVYEPGMNPYEWIRISGMVLLFIGLTSNQFYWDASLLWLYLGGVAIYVLGIVAEYRDWHLF